jgi:simple sugar transport system substrate-binding protein
MKLKTLFSIRAVSAALSISVFGLVSIAGMNSVQAAEKLRAAFVYFTNPGDHGWTYAHDEARKEVQKHFGEKVQTSFVENVVEGPDSVRVIRELAKQGNDVIFTTSFGYMDYTLKVAKEFPDVKFEHISGYKRSPNMATGNVRYYEGRYVQGLVAGLMSKTNKIGYVASFPIPEVIQGINAFGIGLRSVNPKAEVSVVWVNSWYDPVKEADAAKVLIAEGADILAQHTDSPAMLQTAQKAGVHGFGQASDMKAFAPKAQLFSSVNNWTPYYITKIQQILDGKWSTGDGPDHWAGNTWLGMADDYLVLSPFENMPADVAKAATKAAADIKSGKNKIFTGPINDNSGTLRVPAGKTLNDGELFTTLDYYVEGVKGKIPG